ncbi:MAG: alpha/beta fold hydrolase [Patescibacteria group bacterium]|nr:alpha/beta fold hydrolase [Patescibacteria group bacterium]
MRTIFIFHGTEGHPQENWFPWLKEKLEATGKCKVFVPQFPSPPAVPAKIAEWFEVLKGYEQYINEDTILIGHSLGGIFALRILEQQKHPVRAAVFVGTFINPVGIYRDDTFGGFSFDWAEIKANAKDCIVYQSDNDPYVSLANGEELAKNLGVELSFIPNAGHFNAKAGYTKFEALLEKLQGII